MTFLALSGIRRLFARQFRCFAGYRRFAKSLIIPIPTKSGFPKWHRRSVLHSTLRTLHSTLHPLHFTLHTLHFTLYTLHFTLHTLHSTLHTLHTEVATPVTKISGLSRKSQWMWNHQGWFLVFLGTQQWWTKIMENPKANGCPMEDWGYHEGNLHIMKLN